MTFRTFETWEELPVRRGNIERFEVPDGVGTVLLLQYEPQRLTPDLIETGLRDVMDELRARDPAALVLAIPPGWAFRVIKIGDEEEVTA
jgi:hypothetical protein